MRRIVAISAILAIFVGSVYAVKMGDLLGGLMPKPLKYRVLGAGKDLHIYLFEPNDHTAAATRPIVVFMHGGSWRYGEPSLFFPHCRYFASRGILAASIEFRKAPEKPDKKGTNITPADLLNDAREAMFYLKQHAIDLGIDPNAMIAVGESTAAHMAAGLLLLDNIPAEANYSASTCRPDALILLNPATDLTKIEWLKDLPGYFDPKDANQRLQDHSILLHVRPSMPPTLVMHGTADKVVPFDQSQRFVAEMQKQGNKCSFIPITGANHALPYMGEYSNDPTRVRVLTEMDRFLAGLGWLKGEPTIRPTTRPADLAGASPKPSASASPSAKPTVKPTATAKPKTK